MQKTANLYQLISQKMEQYPLAGMLLRTLKRKLQNDSKKVPLILVSAFCKLPEHVKNRLIESFIRTVFNQQIVDDELDFLIGKVLAVELSDIPYCFSLTFFAKDTGRKNKRLLIGTQRTDAVNVTVSGRVNDFITLVTRKEDPDTLFFQRKLLITGDTELGVQLKNFLDDVNF